MRRLVSFLLSATCATSYSFEIPLLPRVALFVAQKLRVVGTILLSPTCGSTVENTLVSFYFFLCTIRKKEKERKEWNG